MHERIDDIKRLRNETGCGLVNAKKILESTNWDYQKALHRVAEENIGRATILAKRKADNGRVEQYAHPGNRLAVLVEVNCETDFAANTQDFKDFCEQIAMQIAAMNPRFMDRPAVTQEAHDDILDKFTRWAYSLAGNLTNETREEKIKERMERWYSEVCLLEQRSIHEHEKSVEELRAALAAKLGENIVIRRWVRWELGQE
jgi:elongation factor Ts